MKKSFKRLQLSRETLGSLDSVELRMVNGRSDTSQACLQASCVCETDGCVVDSWQHTCSGLCCSSMAHC